MMCTQLQRIDEIEIWKQKAFILSRTDRIGRLITKTFDLIQTIVRDGPNAELLIYDMELLKMEQTILMKTDPNQDDLFRSFWYGLSSSFGFMIESLKERDEETSENTEQNPIPIVDLKKGQLVEEEEQNNIEDDFEDNLGFLSGTAKIEDPIDDEVLAQALHEAKEEELDHFLTNPITESAKTLIDRARAIDTDFPIEPDTDETGDEPNINQPQRKCVLSSSVAHNGKDEEKGTTAPAVCPKSAATLTPGNFDCKSCTRTFSTPTSLKNHCRVHKGFQCADCGSRVKSWDTLVHHYADKHPGKEPKEQNAQSELFTSLQCSQCDYKPDSNPKLTVHMRKHTGEKPFSCSKCPKKFTSSFNLTVHMRIHTGEKPFACSKCSKKFNTSGYLKVHMRTHTGEKPYVCSKCPHKFSSSCNLNLNNMSDIQWRRLDEIENWKQKAFVLSRTDRLGRLITKTFDLIQSVVRDGPNAKTLILEVELLREEQLNAMKTDPNQDDIFRSLIYGLSSSLGSMIESIKERNEDTECTLQENHHSLSQEDMNVNCNQLDNRDLSNSHMQESLMDQLFFPEATAKIEILESLQDLSEDDVKPIMLFDLGSEAAKEEDDMANMLKETVDQITVELSAELKDTDAFEIAQPIRKRRRTSVTTKTTPTVAKAGNSAAGKSAAGNCVARKYGCTQCERTFVTPGELKFHRTKFHKGVQCGECDLRKKNMDSLLEHYAESHPGKAPMDTEPNAHNSWQCIQCHYKAQSLSNLKVHMRIHTGEKPFACSKCPVKFAQKGNLKRHVFTNHGTQSNESENEGVKTDNRRKTKI